MLSPRWHKAIAELRVNRSRTALAVLAIFVGVFALGLVTGLSANLAVPLAESYSLVNPASAIMYTSPFADDAVTRVLAREDITHAHGRHRLRVRVSWDGQWYNMELYAIKDFENISVNTLEATSGVWPPGPGQIVLEHSVPGFMPALKGDSLLLEQEDGNLATLAITGFARDLSLPPAPLAGRGYGYINFETLSMLGAGSHYNELYIVTTGVDRESIGTIAAGVRDRELAQAEISAYRVKIPEPGQHVLQGIIGTLMLVLALVGWLALLSGGLLVANIINALLASQVREIGVMKAIGARTGQVAGIYLAIVMAFGLLALAGALPAAWLGSRLLSGIVSGMLNFPAATFLFPLRIVGLQAFAALFIPLTAAVIPILGGARTTVSQAMTVYGIRGGRDSSSSFPRIPRFLLVAVRSTFSKKGRIALTLIALSLSGAIFVSVFSVRDSLGEALENLANYWYYDIEANFEGAVDAGHATAAAMDVPGVTRAEGWRSWFASYIRPDGSENENLTVIAPPSGSTLIKPALIKGRWLRASDTNAIVVNADLVHEEKNINVGSSISLNIGGQNSSWTVIGVVTGQIMGPMAYVNQEYLAGLMGQEDMINRLVLRTEGNSGVYQEKVADELALLLRQTGFSVSEVETSASIISRLEYWFTVPVLLLLAMAGLLAAVGAIGLLSTMSISVLERQREIGVMRAIGASTPAILIIFVGEAVFIGLLSWLAGVILAIPIGWPLGGLVGLTLLKAPLPYVYSISGAVIWLAVSLIIPALVSLVPAWRATRIPVGEALSYE